jgi:flagellar hook-basal body complex protein FliE
MERVEFNQLHPLKSSNYGKKITPAEAEKAFAQSFKEALNKVSATEAASGEATRKFISGEIKDIHTVMIAAQKASVTRTAAVEVRNKVVEAYKEIMRMQV